MIQDEMLAELKRIREAVERMEAGLKLEPVTCRGCSSVFRTHEEYAEHQCGLGAYSEPPHYHNPLCPKCGAVTPLFNSETKMVYCVQCSWQYYV